LQPEAAPVLGCTSATAETSGEIEAEGAPANAGAPDADDRRELAEERAAIHEFEAGLPRPEAERLAGFVRCADCDHWRPSGVQQHGDCAAHAGGTAGLWGTDARGCASYLAADLAAAVRAMGRRWGYAADELAEARARAAVDPEGWRRLIAADLATRRWPGGDGWQEGKV
jgi:hypothetical protein